MLYIETSSNKKSYFFLYGIGMYFYSTMLNQQSKKKKCSNHSNRHIFLMFWFQSNEFQTIYEPRWSIPYRYRLYSTGMYTDIETLMFHTGLNTGRTSHVPVIPANFEQYLPVQKTIFFFFFLSFVIFEFLLGQNSNLFALTYQYYLFSQYAIVTFKLSIFYIVFFS